MKNTLDNKQNGLQKVVLSKTASIISGIVCAIPFVFEKTFFLSFIMYIPLFYLFFNNEKGKYTKVFLYAFGFYVCGYSFLCELYPLDYAGLTPLEALGVIAFALTAIPLIHSSLFLLCFALCKSLTKNSGSFMKIAVFPCIAVFNEFLQTIGPLAFPWCRVSIAQSPFLAFVQSASLFGSYFITYLVLLINALIGFGIMNKAFAKRALITAAILFSVNTAFGALRLAFHKEGDEAFTAIALQANLSSSEKWSGSITETAELYIKLSDEAIAKAKADGLPSQTLILMPETAIPTEISKNSKYKAMFSDYAKANKVNIAVGAFSDMGEKSGNSVFMIDQSGNMQEPYNKRIRVPFGEYLPYRKFFTSIVPALGEINMLSEDLYKGEKAVVFDTSFVKTAPVICYESVFPSLCRESVTGGAQVLLIATNDSWFGSSAALKHHLFAARIRAVENNVPVVRAANTGISAIINSDGTFQNIVQADRRGYAISKLNNGQGNTLYSRVGDIFIPFCLLLTLLDSVKAIFRKTKSK